MIIQRVILTIEVIEMMTITVAYQGAETNEKQIF